MRLLETDDLGLSAFMKMNGCLLVKMINKTFVFESLEGESVEEWQIKYINSCCFRHDTELMFLRKLINKKKSYKN